MKLFKTYTYYFGIIAIAVILSGCKSDKPQTGACETYKTPVSMKIANIKAQSILEKMSLKEKIELLGGYSRFFTKAFPEYGIPNIFMVDATQGVRLDNNITDTAIVKRLEKTTAFPCPILLASTWNPQLAKEYARCVGEEARAAGASFLLGPGMNIYRQSQCGRNFEYFGEDPYLISRMIEKYVAGVQNTGTSATLKHFVANNTDFYRRRSNSIIDERALNEIYLPGFKAGIDAGATAVMTSYNKLNGEWCGQSDYVINELLRKQLGFRWLVMTDWTSVYDGVKVIKSGQNLEMPERKALINTESLLGSGKVSLEEIDQMATSILRTCIAMGFYDRPMQDTALIAKIDEHEKTALEVAREGIVLLKNEGNILPLPTDGSIKIVAAGKYLHKLAHGGGSARVDGYNNVTLAEALLEQFGQSVSFASPSDTDKIKQADVVLLSIGTFDTEGSDRPFDLPGNELAEINRVLDISKNCVILVNSGSGINMAPFTEKASAIIYAWYGGQTGNTALAEILSGAVNPSGKLPITIEKCFEDSPGYSYLPGYEKLYSGTIKDNFTHKEYDISYTEGIFIGYRWYESKNIKPLFAFGSGLSYSNFEYSNLSIPIKEFSDKDKIEVKFTLKNTSSIDGSEIAQLYVRDLQSTHPRPVKELKGFKKVFLKAGEEKEISITLDKSAFSYWNPDIKEWFAEKGEFVILIGSSSNRVLLEDKITLYE